MRTDTIEVIYAGLESMPVCNRDRVIRHQMEIHTGHVFEELQYHQTKHSISSSCACVDGIEVTLSRNDVDCVISLDLSGGTY